MILGQYHEQNNANVKGSGNQWAHRCWMVARQEIGKINLKLRNRLNINRIVLMAMDTRRHKYQQYGVQAAFV